ncbi:hypothetical protein [Reyranella sp. CPCC 100927]|uniref:hypothetical protein n=1 Tax=Reyranella sp. CPCC 100927 TaxID=2599616 RepID=UPI0011B4CB02|nr:hypothetical protein [Reyranella sp. CPCC 100927]TWT15627.1 hypothetical protein FQU96_04565 [Reyranella sp. CPCC 100927]
MKTKLIAAAVAAALTVGIVGPTVAPAFARDGWHERTDWQRREDWRRQQEWQRQREIERQRAWEQRREAERQRARERERERERHWRSQNGRNGHGYCGGGRPRTLEEAAWRHRNC